MSPQALQTFYLDWMFINEMKWMVYYDTILHLKLYWAGDNLD